MSKPEPTTTITMQELGRLKGFEKQNEHVEKQLKSVENDMLFYKDRCIELEHTIAGMTNWKKGSEVDRNQQLADAQKAVLAYKPWEQVLFPMKGFKVKISVNPLERTAYVLSAEVHVEQEK